MTQPQGISEKAPDAPDGPSTSFEARERSERIGAGGGDGSGNVSGGTGDPDGCEGCPSGPVVLEAIIGVDGNVRDVRVLRSSSPLFEGAAADAVRGWRYRPARIGARAVSVYLNVNVTFTLRS